MRVSPKTIQALSLFVPENNVRTYINNIYFELQLNKTILVATNGAAMLVVCVEGGNEKEDNFKIPPASFTKSNIDYEVSRNDEGKVCVVNGLVKIEVPQTEDRYPDFRRVVPGKESPLELKQYDPELLLRFKKASKLLGGQMFPLVHSNNVVDLGLSNVVGVLMNVVVKGANPYTNGTSPAWLARGKD